MRRFLPYLFILLSSVVNGQDISVRAWFDSTKIYIGDQIFYNIEIRQPENRLLNAKYPENNLDSLIQIISRFGPDTVTGSDKMLTISSKYLITSFDSGSYDIPPFYAEYNDGDSLIRYYSDYAHLDVIRTNIAPSDSARVFDIIGPYHERVTFADLAPWLLLFIFVLLLSWFIIRKLKSKRKLSSDDEKDKMPDEPLHIVIFRELDKLERLQLWQKGEIKEFYSRLTEILRHFLELKYSIPSLEMTSSETLASLRKIGFEKDSNYDLLNNILVTADMSKFAKFAPQAEVNQAMIAKSKEFVMVCCNVNSDFTDVDKKVEGEEVSDE